jgi:hypothetical protein
VERGCGEKSCAAAGAGGLARAVSDAERGRLSVRGHAGWRGGRERPGRSDKISWWDRKGHHESRHRPDLVGFRLDGRPIAVEVELAPKSIERLRAILYRHVVWRHAGKSNGVHYICGDEDGLKRIEKAATTGRTFRYDDLGLTVVLLDSEQIVISTCEHVGAGRQRQRNQVVVVGVAADARRVGRVGEHHSLSHDVAEERLSVFGG